MKKILIGFMALLMTFTSLNLDFMKVDAASYTLHEEFETTWKYVVGKTGQPTKMWINDSSWSSAVANNNEVFCIDPTKTSVEGANNTILDPADLGYSQPLMDKLALIAYYGYRSQKNTTNYFLTQNLIWETIGKKRPYDEGIQFVGNSQYPTRESQDAWQKQVMDKVNAFSTTPSFNLKTLEIDKGKTATITDTNKVLNELVVKNVTGGSAVIDGNTLKVTPSADSKTMSIRFGRNISQAQTKTNFVIHAGGDTQPVSNLTSGQDPYRATVSFNVVDPNGYFRIQKKSSYDESLVGGAVYSLTNSKGEVVTYLTTSTSGWVTSGALPLDTYTLKEIKVPDGYKLDTQSYKIELKTKGGTNSKTVYDEPYGYIQIRKKDADTEQDKYLADAVYEIIDSKGKVVDTLTTTSTGEWIKSKQLPLGTYKLKEKVAPAGYMLDVKQYDISIVHPNMTASKTLHDMQQGMVSIYKIDADTKQPLKGVEFAISSKADMSDPFGRKKTNDDGIATFTKLNQGSTYYIQEVSGIDGYVIDDTIHKVWIDAQHQSVSLTIKNNAMKGSVKVLKLDFDTNKPLKNIVFNISDKADMSNILSSEKTNDEGIAVFKDLSLGTYYIQEKENIGYVLNDTIYKAEVTKHEEVIEITVYNKEIVAYFDKIDAYSKERVADVELQIIEKATGTVVDKWITDGKLAHKVSGLFADVEYYLEEVKVPDGYEMADPVLFTLKNNGEEITVVMENTRYVEVTKSDITTGAELEGAKLQVIDKLTNQVVDGWTSTKEPHRISGLVVGKTYILHEDLAPLGYEIANDIEFVYGNTMKIEMKDEPYLEVSKQDITTGVELEGAKLQVIDKETNKVVDEWTSSDEPYKIVGLTTGKEYILHEDLAPLGYEIASDVEFIAGAGIKVEMKDEPYLEVSKQDATTGTELKGAKLQVIDKETNKVVDEWTSSDEPYKIVGLTTDKTYILHEDLAPLGYEIANDIEFVAGAGIKIEMKDGLIYGEIKIQKENEDGNPIENVTFNLAKDRKMQDMIATNKTDEDGICYFRNIPYGTYYIKEESVAGYKVNSKIYEVKITSQKQNVNLVIVNESIQSSFLKIDAYTKKPIEGVALRVVEKESGKVIDEWISTLLPHYILNLEVGKTYLFEEIKSLKGYKKHQPIIFTLENDEGVHLVMENHTMTKITKVDDQLKPLKGVELAIYDHNTLITKWISDEKPHIIYDLEIDKQYTLKELKGLEGYKMADEIIIKAGDDITFINERLGNITLHKIEEGSKKPIMNLTFEFELYKDKTCKEKILRVKTNDQGIAYFKDLEYGTYYIKEVKSAQDYLLSKQILKVEVNKNNVDVNFENSKSVKTGVGSNPSTPYIMLLVFSFIVIVVTNKAILIKNDKKKMKKIKK